ncbi:MAG: aminotransferase class V-fold PLP-dependent enzyme [Lachnospiraceae bacterium]|nr:aminotransferase class V-fold PLP-dependent enzyme [Lachnospiraceae bacterium]
MIYLDNAASTKPSENVIRKMNEIIDIFGNPSSLHTAGVDARYEIVKARQIIADKLNCQPKEINFTSGASMSNSLFIQGFLSANPNGRLIISSIEHDDIIMLADYLDSVHGSNWVYRIGVDREGQLDVDQLVNVLSLLDGVPILCCIQWANGECGVIQDIPQISSIIHNFDNAYLYTDATQYIPYYQIDLDKIHIDGLGMSGQKINCIKGTGLLYVRDGVNINPIIFGRQGLIGGTENVIGISALGQAFKELDYDNTELITMKCLLVNELKQIGIIIGGSNTLPNNVCVCFDTKHDGDYWVATLDEFGVCVSSGSACSSASDEPSHVILAMGYLPDIANSCIRFTLSKSNTIEEIHEVVKLVNEIVKNMEDN